MTKVLGGVRYTSGGRVHTKQKKVSIYASHRLIAGMLILTDGPPQ